MPGRGDTLYKPQKSYERCSDVEYVRRVDGAMARAARVATRSVSPVVARWGCPVVTLL